MSGSVLHRVRLQVRFLEVDPDGWPARPNCGKMVWRDPSATREVLLLELMKAVWRRWKTFTHSLNYVISWVLMTFVYVVAVAPVAIGFKVFRPDPIDRGLGDPSADSYGLPAKIEPQDIRRAQRPW